jgi:hypothetical protein
VYFDGKISIFSLIWCDDFFKINYRVLYIFRVFKNVPFLVIL